jgi:hypothetical protein
MQQVPAVTRWLDVPLGLNHLHTMRCVLQAILAASDTIPRQFRGQRDITPMEQLPMGVPAGQ